MSLLDSHTPHRRKGSFGRKTMRLGEDILLARHGSHISRMSHDRRNQRMVAVLDNGTVDYASNVLLAPRQTPITRLQKQIQDIRDDASPIRKADLRVLGWFTAGWAVISALFIVGIFALASTSGGAAFAQAATTFPSY
ncbi:hypothetical protein [Sinomonas humi]|uniref:Uncharacterized protein n=1 Tax=Sinomonas humi TaxID=1338436 RepID=A0A0B2AQ70_9MICC|nr:hypothetical protein [Sinomonas humi]KHL04008.1 hypothetical protein LK10_07095 [Sinomonas humi]